MNKNPETENILPPFTDDFICPNCEFLDKGTFCSNCGEKLIIPIGDIRKNLSRRLEKLGYEKFNSWKEHETLISQKYNLSEFDYVNGQLFCRSQPSNKGMSLELFLIIQDSIIGDEEIISNINDYLIRIENHIKGQNKLKRKERSKKPEEFLGQLKFRIVRIRDKSIQKGNSIKFKGKNKIKTKTGIRAFSFMPTYRYGTLPPNFTFDFSWDFIELNSTDAVIYSERNEMFDLLKHQVKIVSRQSDALYSSKVKEKKDNIFLNTLQVIIESFIEYFKLFYQYLKNPYYLTDLVVDKKFVSLGKIINLYFVGLVCSISIPAIISGGHLNANNLTMFSDLPPFISEIAELLFEIVVLFLLAIFMHIVLRIARYKGDFWSLLVGLLFMKAFFQLIDRPYNYLTDIFLLNALGGDYKLYTDIVYKFLAPIYFLVYAFFLFPLLYVVYKASRTITVTAFTVAGITMLVIASFAAGDFIISPSQLTKDRFDALLTEEQAIIEVYTTDVMPYLDIGDKTGDYTKPLEGLKKCKELFVPLIEKCKKTNKEIINSFRPDDDLTLYSNAQCEYFNARQEFFIAFENYLNGEINREEWEESSQNFSDKLDALEEINKRI